MDDDRRIRFLVSPFVFVVFLLWSLALDPARSLDNLLPAVSLRIPNDLANAVAALAAGGSAVFVIGLAIGTLTHVALRASFTIARWRKGRSQEIALSAETLKAICRAIGMNSNKPSHRDELFVAVCFDHGSLHKDHGGLHTWIRRRWSAFNISASSATAILLAYLASLYFDISLCQRWYVPAGLLFLVFVASAVCAWRDTMQMYKFMATTRLANPPPSGG